MEGLCRALALGGRVKFVFFWSHQPSAGRAACLSQWYESPFELWGEFYPTAEHFMMAEKARLFGDNTSEAAILEAASPGHAKQLGRGVAGFSQGTWDAERFGVAVRGNLAKFGQNPDLRDYLVGTHERVLVEASPTDPIWGIGLAKHESNAEHPDKWAGLNLLGFALMEVRAVLASEFAV